MLKADPLHLGNQAEQRAVSIEVPWPSYLDNLGPGFVMTVQKLIGDLSGRCFVSQLKCFGTEPLHADHHDEAVGQDAANHSINLEIFKLHALLLSPVHIREPDGLSERSTP